MTEDEKRAAPSAEAVFDPRRHDELARAVAQLSPEEAAFFLKKLEAAVTKRKIQLTGYLVAMGVWLAAMFGALIYYGTHDGFIGWVFLVPFGFVGVILWWFGRRAERAAETIRITGGPPPPAKPAGEP
ncbi:MAG TPA: hypothetical protein VNO30_48500 [Kofleriaceae bacterium]|nr:hypothetical protein [Kofleriaceae bacterium]